MNDYDLKNNQENVGLKNNKNVFSTDEYLKFLLPSLLGVLFFLVPINIEGKTTIFLGFMIDYVHDNYKSIVVFTLVAICVLSAVFSFIVTLLSYKTGEIDNPFLRIFKTTPLWLLLRIIGAIVVYMVVFKTGPEMVTSAATGGTAVNVLATKLVVLFFFASLFLPLLTDYGLMEFVGAIFTRFFRLLFNLPGRSAIDALASWLGAAVIGVMLTMQEYHKGGYSRKEAATIATNFSIVSLPFCLVIAEVIGLSHVFVEYYACIIFIGFVCAIILPRIPPLSTMPHVYFDGKEKPHVTHLRKQGESFTQAGIRMAVEKAKSGPNFVGLVRKSLLNTADIWLGILPATIAIATISLVLVEMTPIFNYIAYPFEYLLRAFNLPEAQQAAPAMVVGFADMYVPALIGKGIESEVTRFLIGILSVGQLIYMSEVGALLLRSKVGLNLGHLFAIFILRTIIATPIAIFIAKYIVFS